MGDLVGIGLAVYLCSLSWAMIIDLVIRAGRCFIISFYIDKMKY